MKSTSLIQLNQVRLAYKQKVILDDMNTSIEKGDFVAISGPSGAGKSTLLFLLAGLMAPKKGDYTFLNEKVYRFREWGLSKFRKNNIGFVFQDFRLLPYLTVRQNIEFPMFLTSHSLEKNRTQSLLQKLRIAHRSKAYPHQISGGEAQRTAIARAIFLKPKLLILDEPTGNLDNNTEEEISATLNGLIKEGLTIVCTTHSQYLIKNASRHLTIEGNKLIEKKVRKVRKKK